MTKQYKLTYTRYGDYMTLKAVSDTGQVIASASYPMTGNNVKEFESSHEFVHRKATEWQFNEQEGK